MIMINATTQQEKKDNHKLAVAKQYRLKIQSSQNELDKFIIIAGNFQHICFRNWSIN